MKAGAFDYVRPKSLSEALGLLAEADGEAQLMAGGQSLVAMMNLRVASPALVIDIGRLPELRIASEDEHAVSLGACVTHAAIEDGLVPDASRGLMPKAASCLAYRAIRTRGTIGGSLALADPAAEWPTVLASLSAQAVLRGPAGRRTVSSATFVTGIFETSLEPGELVESIRIPKLPPAARWGYVKFCRKSGEFASSIAAVVRDPGRSYARAVLGAANGAPIVLERTSELVGAGGREPAAIDRAIADDLAAARERRFDEFQLVLHATIAARAVGQVLG
jgi:aerobic carbon-monoxide dehydrogenase medium subunit